MRILVVGSGAIGGVVGGHLSLAGEDVVLVDRSEDHVRAMQERGLLIDGVRGEFRIPVTAVTPAEVRGTFDVVLLAVKAQHTGSALQVLEGHLSEDGFVVSLQNGLDTKPFIAQRIGAERTIGAMVRLAAAYRGPGHVTQNTPGIIVVGELDGRITPRLQRLQMLLDKVTPTSCTDNIWGWIWAKTVYGAFLATVSTVDATVAEVLELPGTEEVVIQAMTECATVAAASGVRLEAFDFLDPTALLGNTSRDRDRVKQDLLTIRERFGHIKSGILRDLTVRRIPLELDAGAGGIVKHGQRVGVPTPIITQVCAMLVEAEQGKRALVPANIAELHRYLQTMTLS